MGWFSRWKYHYCQITNQFMFSIQPLCFDLPNFCFWGMPLGQIVEEQAESLKRQNKRPIGAWKCNDYGFTDAGSLSETDTSFTECGVEVQASFASQYMNGALCLRSPPTDSVKEVRLSDICDASRWVPVLVVTLQMTGKDLLRCLVEIIAWRRRLKNLVYWWRVVLLPGELDVWGYWRCSSILTAVEFPCYQLYVWIQIFSLDVFM